MDTNPINVRAYDVFMYPAEFMDNREVEARELNFKLKWDKDGVWLFHPDGEGGRFNKSELLYSEDDLETFFWRFF